jgi:hypothetical protein
MSLFICFKPKLPLDHNNDFTNVPKNKQHMNWRIALTHPQTFALSPIFFFFCKFGRCPCFTLEVENLTTLGGSGEILVAEIEP